MFKIELICVSKMRNSAYFEIFQDYHKRLQWHLIVKEIDSPHKQKQKTQKYEEERMLSYLKSHSISIALDEHGKSFSSIDFAKKLEKYAHEGHTEFQFLIGGAYGLSETVKKHAHFSMSFGQQTWPHLMVRIMLIEQIYRSQQILAGHPYHKE